jgi:hypothetical protein
MVPRSPLPDNHAIDSLVSSISLKSPQEGANRYRSTSEASNTKQKTPLDNIRSIWRKHQAYAKLGKQITDHKTIAETPTTTTIVECTPCLNNPPTSSGILSQQAEQPKQSPISPPAIFNHQVPTPVDTLVDDDVALSMSRGTEEAQVDDMLIDNSPPSSETESVVTRPPAPIQSTIRAGKETSEDESEDESDQIRQSRYRKRPGVSNHASLPEAEDSLELAYPDADDVDIGLFG